MPPRITTRSSRFAPHKIAILILLLICVPVEAQSTLPIADSSGSPFQSLPAEPVRQELSATDLVKNSAGFAPPARLPPENLTVWTMFSGADWFVRSIMIMLAIASLLSWTIAFAKGLAINTLRKHLIRQNYALAEAETLYQATGIQALQADTARALLNAARNEVERSGAIGATGIKERVLSRLNRIETAQAQRLSSGINVLASIGATAPFIGLLGTVWGIMNAFIGISRAQTTSLAVVAPGIAEALLATALGLVAAIPAVLIYNYFSRRIAAIRVLLADQSALVMQLLSRDLDQQRHGGGSAN